MKLCQPLAGLGLLKTKGFAMVDLTVYLKSGDERLEVKERHDLISAFERIRSIEALPEYIFSLLSSKDKIIYDSRIY